jgi:SAM-dependent methyltransferase
VVAPPPVGPLTGVIRSRTVDWDGYLDRFHRDAAGITEDLLASARDEAGGSPYAWILSGADLHEGRVVDVGCGSAPTGAEARHWVGLDRSAAELRRCTSSGRTPVVQGDSARLPFPDGSAATVLSSMSLMVTGDPFGTLLEARRVLQPGGTLLVLVPAAAPMTMRDRFRMGLVMAIVGTVGFPFPHREVLRRTSALLRRAGFVVEAEEARRFGVPMRGPVDGEGFVRALYLPGVADWRVRLALKVARRWRGALGIPLRRIVARRPLGDLDHTEGADRSAGVPEARPQG